LTAGEDLPTRDDINQMARPWNGDSARVLVEVLFAQLERRLQLGAAPQLMLAVIAGILFLLALAVVPLVWGGNNFAVWMPFAAPLLAGGAGAAIRSAIGPQVVSSAVIATIVVGLVAGRIAGALFVS
jgi:hypothetical protein